MFVFLILGIIQLGLMHQARLMTKYAAYRAVRAGAIWNAQKSKMKAAATAALLPVIASNGNVQKTAGASSYLQKWIITQSLAGKMMDWPLMDHVEVQTCGPLKGDFGGGVGPEVDFDDPKVHWGTGAPLWSTSTKNKLRVQVTLNYRLIIPFANTVIHGIFTNMGTNPVLHLGKTGKNAGGPRMFGDYQKYTMAGMAGIYAIPIRATYTMRMQSNIFTAELPPGQSPAGNPCKFSFSYN